MSIEVIAIQRRQVHRHLEVFAQEVEILIRVKGEFVLLVEVALFVLMVNIAPSL